MDGTPFDGLQQKRCYRAFLLGQTGHIDTFSVIEAASDEDAVEQARELGSGRVIEVWDQGRMIGRCVSLGARTPEQGRSDRHLPL